MILRHSNLGRDTCIYTYVYVIYIHTYTHMYIIFFFSSHSVLLTQVSCYYWPGYIYSVCVYIYIYICIPFQYLVSLRSRPSTSTR